MCLFFLHIIAGIYNVYDMNSVQMLITVVMWNFYVLSLQFGWSKSYENEIELPRSEQEINGKEDNELKYFDNKYEVEFSKQQTGEKLVEQEQFPYVAFDEEKDVQNEVPQNEPEITEEGRNGFDSSDNWAGNVNNENNNKELKPEEENFHWRENEYWDGQDMENDNNATWNGEVNENEPFGEKENNEGVVFKNEKQEKDKLI